MQGTSLRADQRLPGLGMTGKKMDQWYSRNLGDAMLAGQYLEGIEKQFKNAYLKAGQPADMALYVRHESEGRLHCEVVIYLSPASTEVAAEIGASSCSKPSFGDIGLLAGGA
jgi:hypothetical protein